MSNTCASVISYDVFLSFRGKDTRLTFTDHLYDALKRAGIYVFRDNEDINRGEKLKPEIERAIMESKTSIIVLSENYASSSWCLEELRLILEQGDHFVLPVFYHINPSDVRKLATKINFFQNGKLSEVMFQRRKSLEMVAQLAGEVITSDTHESIALKNIVSIILDKLDRNQIFLPSNLTGMEIRCEEINSWFQQSDDEFLAICGMGGSGKTTLARYIVNSNWHKFENISIVEYISGRCKEPQDLLQLQDKLLRDIVGGKKRKTPSVCQGTSNIEEILQKKKVLLVLDDIVEPSQLVALLGTGDINKQSKIIITTTVNNPGLWFASRSWRCREYKMRLLDNKESLELLCLHAFKSKEPLEGFNELAEHAVEYCEGNPLALELLGSSLSESNTISFWESHLNLLDRNIDSRIQEVLIKSYTSLSFDSYKELFLHIACFFVGIDVDYVTKILRHDFSTVSGIQILINRCLVYVSPNKKLMMHRLLQEMGRNIVRQESYRDPAKRSRVWLNRDSYMILKNGEGSGTIEGLALDMKMLKKEKFALKSSKLKTDSLREMRNLRLLQLNYVELTGSYENLSENLRWLCCFGFHLTTMPSHLFMGNLVAIDMSYSKLKEFNPPVDLHSLEFLNLKDSTDLTQIGSFDRIPNLETLILWNCYSLVNVCQTINTLRSLTELNMTGCKKVCVMKQVYMFTGSDSYPTFDLPRSLKQLFLNDCDLECGGSFRLGFRSHPFMKYLNLAGSLFEFLPSYGHLTNLRVLDLSFCSRFKELVQLPNTLAELYIYYCTSLERVSFQSHRFTLQEFGYGGCTNLSEIEGFLKIVPIAKLDETDLGHMKWLKKYQNHYVFLVGDDELTIGRLPNLQMLSEFNIMSTSLPDIKDQSLMTEYTSESPSLSFEIPLSPGNRRLKGLNITFRYAVSEDDWTWFARIRTTNAVNLIYNPRVFGKPAPGEVGIWFSYWPIGNALHNGDKVDVSISVMNGLVIYECGASLVYSDDEAENETLQNNNEWVETLREDLSGFQLSTGAYYLCRRDLFELMEVGRITPGWLSILVGDSLNDTEVLGWRKTGRPTQLSPSFTVLKTVRCVIHGSEEEQIYKIAEMSKLSSGNRFTEFRSAILKQTTRFSSMFLFPVDKEIMLIIEFGSQMNVELKEKVLNEISALLGVYSVVRFPIYERRLTILVRGTIDPVTLCSKIRKHAYVELVNAKNQIYDVSTIGTIVAT